VDQDPYPYPDPYQNVGSKTMVKGVKKISFKFKGRRVKQQPEQKTDNCSWLGSPKKGRK
jgi:hypothetical protein